MRKRLRGRFSARDQERTNTACRSIQIATGCLVCHGMTENDRDTGLSARMPELTLVAGAGGFIGGQLVRDLDAKGVRVRAIDRKPIESWYYVSNVAENRVGDLAEKATCLSTTHDVDWVYNLAADMGGMGFIENNKALCMLSVLINTHLLMAAKANGVSSATSTPRRPASTTPTSRREVDVEPLKEADAYPAMPEDGYGWEKLFSERMCRHFREDFGLRDARRPATTTSTARTAPGTAAARRRRRRSAARSSRRQAPASTRSRSGATASRPAASCTSTTASRAPSA